MTEQTLHHRTGCLVRGELALCQYLLFYINNFISHFAKHAFAFFPLQELFVADFRSSPEFQLLLILQLALRSSIFWGIISWRLL